jgi:hypothetical protein
MDGAEAVGDPGPMTSITWFEAPIGERAWIGSKWDNRVVRVRPC